MDRLLRRRKVSLSRDPGEIQLLYAAVFSVLLLFASISPGYADRSDSTHVNEARWQGLNGKPLPFETDEEVQAFLREARILSQKELDGGINRPLKLRLELNGSEANAIFRLVDVKLKRARIDGRLVSDFHDSHIYECAAYKVSLMLGIDNVPPCVKRRIQGINGTVQLWVESAMTEKKRRDEDLDPPEILQWMRQKQTMRLFDALIYNFDRNQGNMLIDSSWKLWFIDHTRSFRVSSIVEKPEKLIWCEREVWGNLKALNKKALAKNLKGYVSPIQVNTLLKRRDKITATIEARIGSMGEGAVLYDASSSDMTSGLAELVLDDEIPLTSSPVEKSIDP